jgi:hypothetical protein
LKKFPGLFTKAEIHALKNLRGVPNVKNCALHLGLIRRMWNFFYRNNPNPSKGDILNWAKLIDWLFGHNFTPPV